MRSSSPCPSSCARSASAACSKDLDCEGDTICEAGACVAVGAVSEPSTVSPPAAAAPAASECGGCTTDAAVASAAAPSVARPSHPNKPLLVSGIVALSAGYFIALVAGGVATATAGSQTEEDGGSCVDGATVNFLPLIGPWLFAAKYPKHQIVTYKGGHPQLLDCNSSRSLVNGIVVVDEILQLGGAAMLAAGLALRTQPEIEATHVARIEVLPDRPAVRWGSPCE